MCGNTHPTLAALPSRGNLQTHVAGVPCCVRSCWQKHVMLLRGRVWEAFSIITAAATEPYGAGLLGPL